MMTQPHTHQNTFTPVFGIDSFFHDAVPASADTGRPHLCVVMPEQRDCVPSKKTGAVAPTEEMPLWPSLKKMRPAMETNAPVKKETQKALKWRSAAIGVAMVSATILGLALIF